MTLLFIHNRYRWIGGEDGMFATYVDVSRALGHRVLTYTRGGRSESLMQIARLFIFPLNLLYSVESYVEIDRLIRTEKPDAAVVFNLFPFITISALLAVRRYHIPIVLRIPNYRLFPAFNASQFFLRRNVGIFRIQDAVYAFIAWCYHWLGFSGNITNILVPSQYMKERLVRINPHFAKRISVIENCSPAELFESRQNPVTRPGQFTLVYVGRLSPEKGVDVLLRSLVHTRNISALIIGNGPDRPALQKMVNRLGLSHVYFVGQVEGNQKIQLMEYADCCVVPSVWPEPFGLTVVEAMAMGICVVASGSGALPSIITDKKDGVLFKPDDPKDLADKLNWLAEHPAVVRETGRRARSTAKRRFTEGLFRARLQAFFQSMLAYKR